MAFEKLTEKEIESIIDQADERADEEYRFEAGELGIHSQSEENYRNAFNDIESVIEEYNGIIDLKSMLIDEYDKDNEPVLSSDGSIIDIANSLNASVTQYETFEDFHEKTNNQFRDYEFEKQFYTILRVAKEELIKPEHYYDYMKIEILKNKNTPLSEVLINSIQKFKINSVKDTIKENYKNINPSKILLDRIISPINEGFFTLKKENKQYLNQTNDFFYRNFVYRDFEKTILNAFTKYPEEILNIISKYNTNTNIYKNASKLPKDDPFYFNILEKNTITDGNLKGQENLEQIYDQMEIVERRAKTKKFAKTFIGSYNHLMDDTSYDLFYKIKEKNIGKSFIKERLKKIATFQNSDDLNQCLNTIINLKKRTNSDILEYIQENNINASILLNRGGKLFIEINDFNASNQLGSKSWCISTSNRYYTDYKKDSRKHVFIFDENKLDSDNTSMIAFTYDYKESKITHAHNINDKNILHEIRNIIPRHLLNDACNKVTENNLLFSKNEVNRIKQKRNLI